MGNNVNPKGNFAYWLRMALPEHRVELAEACGTTVGTLYSISSGRRRNPSIERAMDIVNKIEQMNAELRPCGVPLPDVTIDDIYAIAKQGKPQNTGVEK